MIGMMEVECAARGLRCLVVENAPDWQRIVARSRFTLAPRGMGKTSYRVAEAIQLESLPIYGYIRWTTLWVPYEDSAIDLRRYGFIVHIDAPNATYDNHLASVLSQVEEIVKDQTQTRFLQMQAEREKAECIRVHTPPLSFAFTHAGMCADYWRYAGMTNMIHAFVQSPLESPAGLPHLQCSKMLSM
jgi:hypothetical protein